MTPRRLPILIVAAIAAVVLVAGCGSDSDTSSSGTTTTTTAPTGVVVSGQWARTSPMDAENGAVYLTLRAATTDALTAASVESTVASTTELHETVSASSGSSTSMMGTTETTTMGGDGVTSSTPSTMDSGGELSMQPVSKIDLPAGTDVALKPGGYHIMLIKLAEPLTNGGTIKVTLSFDKSPSQTIEVPVRDDAP